MRSAISNDEEGAKPAHGARFAALVAQVRLAILTEVDREFVECQELAALDVTTAQFAVIKNVLKGSAQSACELCNAMNYDRGAMSRMIDRLENKRLIRRVPLTHTRRSVALEVTAAGKTAFPKMEACVERVVNRMLKGVSKTQVREVEKVLAQMLANT